MRQAVIVALNEVDGSEDQSSEAIDSRNMLQISVQVISSDLSTGDVSIEVSNDPIQQLIYNGNNASNTPQNWSPIIDASVSVTEAGVYLIEKLDVCYNFIRVVFTAEDDSGDGTITAYVKSTGF